MTTDIDIHIHLAMAAAAAVLLSKRDKPHPTLSHIRFVDMTNEQLLELMEWHGQADLLTRGWNNAKTYKSRRTVG